MIKIHIADDHAIVREGLKRIISTTQDMTVVHEAADGNEALEKISRNDCDIALLDISMPGISGLDILQQLRKSKALAPGIIILSVSPEEQYAERALRGGARGYLTKISMPEELLSAICAVYQGKKYISKALSEKLAFALERGLQKLPHDTLSQREYSIMCMIARGRKPQEIGRELSISPKTVSVYRTRILEKMGMKTNAELVQYVLENELQA